MRTEVARQAVGAALVFWVAASTPVLVAPSPPAVRVVRADGPESLLEFRFPLGAGEVTGAIALPAGSIPEIEVVEADCDPPLPAGQAESLLRGAVAVSQDGRLGDQRFLRLTAQAWLPSEEPEAPGHRIRRLLVRVRATGSDLATGLREPRPLFEPVVRSALLNYEPEAGSLAPSRSEPAGEAAAGESTASWAVKISVRDDGLYRIEPADLLAAGVDPSTLDPRRFELSLRGQPVAALVFGEEDGRFDAGDRLLFYGQGRAGFVALENVYWLREAEASGLRMETRGVAPGGGAVGPADFNDRAVAEKDLLLSINNFAADGDYYFWQFLNSSAEPTAADYPMTVPDPVATGPVARLTAVLEGRTTGGHHARLSWNGMATGGEATWTGQETAEIGVDLDPALVLDGANLARVAMVNDTGINSTFVNRFRLEYRRRLRAPGGYLRFQPDPTTAPLEVGDLPESSALLFDLSDPTYPLRLTGALISGSGESFSMTFQDPSGLSSPTYLVVTAQAEMSPPGVVLDVPSSLRDTAQGADYLVISHADFIPALQPLIAHRQQQGLRTALIDVTDVYDEFNDGIFDPEAIRAFVKFAYESWQPPAPTYLLLVGDGNIDYQDRLATGVRNFIPPALYQAPMLGLAPQDNHYVAVSGDDPVPDLFVGRLPVKTAAQTQAVVTKILAYETQPVPAAMESHALLVADNDDPNFEGILDSLDARHLQTTGGTSSRVYLRSFGSGSLARDAIVQEIDTGSSLVAYVGHGNFLNWANENMFQVSDMSRLGNAGRYPLVTSLNCLNGYFAGPRPPSSDPALSEAFLLAADKGAIGYWSPSGIGALSDYDIMGDELFKKLFRERDLALGGATTHAKVQAYLNQGIGEVNLPAMVYLGDPATPFGRDPDLDGLVDFTEISLGSDLDDSDSDDDGLVDGAEPPTGLLNPDADGDGIFDGTETGVTQPSAGTDTSRGFFRSDADPASLTNPLSYDSDSGGAPDSAEDRNLNGAIDPGETDPTQPTDDAVCAQTVPPEIDPAPVSGLRLEIQGADIVVRWTPATSADPCIVYHLYVATDVARKNSADAFTLLATTGEPSYRHPGAALDGKAHDYLVTGYSFLAGEGPLGHYGR